MADEYREVGVVADSWDGLELEIGVEGGAVTFGCGLTRWHLDKAAREEFSRLYFEAERQAEAAAPHVTHWTPEEHDQPACDADVDAPADTVMWGTLNPDKVTCPDCVAAMAAKAATMPP